ncbi:transient receptor potential cation channel subfamily A member 1-like isoform X2 [Dendronephthya gigantea]|uniref:transient receptor potential cation channel subfamily A member 1-like isoform X2 n=1 Tax=Dendronephthya gigantea TaxID=151771 RepID=UPI00106CBA98|nr:transient receptor potential cation channel subfamily A member 1-like isoform X2 [Dendronephthya gigantea]
MEPGERMPMNVFKGDEEPAEDDNDGGLRESVTSISDIGFGNPLMSAVRRGQSLRANYFQEIKLDSLDIKETDNYQRNVFHYAVSKPDTLRKLLENAKEKSSVDEALHQADNKQGDTPIHRAVIIANIESLKILYEYDNSLLKLETKIARRSALHLAVKSKSMIAVKFVLSKDPDSVNRVDNMLQTPVHYAAGIRQSNVLEFLISKGGDTTLPDANNQMALHIAASKGLKKNVALLLQENPDSINIADNSSRTSLLLAAQNNFPNLVSYLLSLNADYEIPDKFGLSAFDWAFSSNSSEVVHVFLKTEVWKKIVSNSHRGPEGSLASMIESMPEMAKVLLDKCVSTEGSKETRDLKVIYDFFCLEQKGMNGRPRPQFEALNAMIENECEICLGHPLSVKYVKVKWRKRGFKYSLASIIVNLIFHICLMVYAVLVVGKVHPRQRFEVENVRNDTHHRHGVAPTAPGIMLIRSVLLIIIFATVTKNIFQVKVQGLHYFKMPRHYFEIMLHVAVVMFLLPVTEELSLVQIGSGSFAVLLSWFTLIQFLKVIPVMGIYIIVVQKIFWTLMKFFKHLLRTVDRI